MNDFTSLSLHEQVLEGIFAMGFKNPTPIQEQAIPLILNNEDLIACAQTGTGKTAAYLLPALHQIFVQTEPIKGIHTLIIVPTRELALQIDQQLQGFSYFVPVTSTAIYGGGAGDDFMQQKKALVEGADIIIATPGKLISHLNMGYVKLGNLKQLILDEADRMLDMGFYDDIMRIVSYLPKERQTLLFSATMPPKIRKLSEKVLTNPKEISLAISKPAEKVTQAAFVVYEHQKIGLIEYLLRDNDMQSVIVFSSTKKGVKDVVKAIEKYGRKVQGISSDMEQSQREKTLQAFKNGSINVLVSTDVIARGIHIEGVNMVINYDVPHDAEDYIHRVGRTARASSEGEAVTFITPEDAYRFQKIEKLLGKEIRKAKVPSFLGEVPEYQPKLKKKLGRR
ncbi:MAG: DEAD/DEAH box helicase [Flammeovirgaceae bacterium]